VKCWPRILRERDVFGDVSIDDRMALKLVADKWRGIVCNGMKWLRVVYIGLA
jgi:hypothetical protein